MPPARLSGDAGDGAAPATSRILGGMGEERVPEGLLTPREACKLLGISVHQLRSRHENGEIPFVWRGAHRRYPADKLLAYKRSLAGAKRDAGAVDAQAIEMLVEGASEGEVIRALKIPLERVRALREAQFNVLSSGDPSATSAVAEAKKRVEAEVQRAYEAADAYYARRRAELRARRESPQATPQPSKPPQGVARRRP